MGSVPLQTPSFRQVLERSPAVTSKPKSHAYVAVDPGLLPLTDTWPSGGLNSCGHLMTTTSEREEERNDYGGEGGGR